MQKKSFGYWFAASTEFMCKILTATGEDFNKTGKA